MPQNNFNPPQRGNKAIPNQSYLLHDKTFLSGRKSYYNDSAKYRVILVIYCFFLLITGFLITFFPLSWLSLPAVQVVLSKMRVMMPGLAWYSNLSRFPLEFFTGYCIAIFTIPVHSIFFTLALIDRYFHGHFSRQNVRFLLTYGWVASVALWAFFFSTIFHEDEPSWQDYAFASSRLLIATFGQGFVGFASAYPGCLVLSIIVLLDNGKHLKHSGGNSDDKQ